MYIRSSDNKSLWIVECGICHRKVETGAIFFRVGGKIECEMCAAPMREKNGQVGQRTYGGHYEVPAKEE